MMRIWTTLAVLLLLLPALWVLQPARAMACDCMVPENAGAALEDADAVFTGTVLDIAKQPRRDMGYDAVILEVDKAWKGVDATQVIVYTSWSSCMFNFVDGESYLLYAYKSGENLEVSNCGRSVAVNTASAAEDLAMLGEGQVPTIEVDLQSRFSDWQPIIVWGSAIGGLLLVLIGVLMILRRLRG
ncbi:hypothetical protein [Paenibacillus daejeonensis]|uniref:hypothetical protein n=1 Tax=Paenibacillus daejeonensis TaxID=135193 RepID=UPI0012F7E3C2|nr:hypothetical protein [Paenibacillus daejeonensis]